MGRDDIYSTKGKQFVLFENASFGQMLLIMLVYFLNLVMIVSMDSFLIHNIPKAEMELPALADHIPGQIFSVKQMDSDYLILYETETGEKQLAKASKGILYRYHMNQNIATISENPAKEDSLLLDYTIRDNEIVAASQLSLMSSKLQVGLIIALAFLLTVLERLLFQKLRGQ